MVTAAWDTSNLVALYKDGKQCVTCCAPPGGWSDFDVGCFIDGSGVPTCGSNPDLDEWPPFGGPGKTPAIYTITIDGYILCDPPLNSPAPDINGVWHLPIENCSWPLGEACWVLHTTIGGINVTFDLQLCNSFTFIPTINISAPGETLFYRDIVQHCNIVADNVSNFFVGCGIPGSRSGGGGVISWRPGQIAEWDNSTAYVIGDKVAHEAVFYICTADHTNQEPPNAGYWDVI